MGVEPENGIDENQLITVLFGFLYFYGRSYIF